MELRDLHYEEDYYSGEDNFVRDFLRPCLRISHKYWRAVGYFRSSALECYGDSLNDFVQNNGEIRVIASVELTEQDLEAVKQGLLLREACARRLEQIIEEDFSNPNTPGIRRLVSLLEANLLQIKIAIRRSTKGLYHEKLGIFFDQTDYVAFSGSTNESRHAFEITGDCVDVYTSWKDPKRAERKKKRFERLWSGEATDIDTFEFPDAIKKRLIQKVKDASSHTSDHNHTSISLEEKWRHQAEAEETFIAEERGILEMATGTGKTRTAVNILTTLFKLNQIDAAIICTKGTDLLNQWYKSIGHLKQTFPDSRGLTIFRQYDNYKEVRHFERCLKDRRRILIVSRHFLCDVLKNIATDERDRLLLIHDEVHGLGSETMVNSLTGLSDTIRYRLGLSATPEREYDETGNDFIERDVGPVIYKFELDEAIRRGIVTPFNYFPLHYSLTDEDKAKLRDVYKAKARAERAGQPMTNEEFWTRLSAVYKTSTAKLPIFSDFIQANPHLLQRCLIFVERKDYGDQVLSIIHQHRPDFHTYYGGDDVRHLEAFGKGDLECLITCHKLSEGIDIRSTNTVILFASSRARLETIQRIGRCLRVDPNNSEKIANVVDFICDRESANIGRLHPDLERESWLTSLSNIRQAEVISV